MCSSSTASKAAQTSSLALSNEIKPLTPSVLSCKNVEQFRAVRRPVSALLSLRLCVKQAYGCSSNFCLRTLERVFGYLHPNEVAASRDFIGKFVRRPLPKRPVRTSLIIFLPPSFNSLVRLC